MKTAEYPGSYQAADQASLKAQKNYLRTVRADLAFMIAGACLVIYNFEDEICRLVIYSFSAFAILVSLTLTIILKSKAYEDTWYQGRALSESIKTLTWRYMTCSELFESHLPDQEVKRVFTHKLKELANEFKDLNKYQDAALLSMPLITPQMENIRALNTLDRRNYYIQHRIRDQKTWYTNKAAYNQKKYNGWFWVIVISQFLSFVSIIILIKLPTLDWNVVGLFTTISAVALSWLQLKQHQALKQAYTTAAQELNFIEVSAASVNTDNELSRFVLDSENAISREHTLWLAQKRR